MTYTRAQANWQNDSAGGTPINRVALNMIEAGIVNVDSRVTTIETLPGTNQGALIVSGAGGTLTRQLIGTDGQVLTADHAQTTGMRWATPASGGITSVNGHTGSAVTVSAADVGLSNVTNTAQVPASLLNAQAALASANSSGVPGKLDASANFGGEVLTYDGSQTLGLKWAFPAYGNVEKAGASFTPRPILNFIGAGVTVADSGGTTTDVTIAGGAAGFSSPYTVQGYGAGPAGYVPIAAAGSYQVTLTQNSFIRIGDITGETWAQITIAVIQDSTGGHTCEFMPGTIHWIGNAQSRYDTADSTWSNSVYPPGLRGPFPIIDTTANSVTFVRLTWLGTLTGFVGEVVTNIPALYTPFLATAQWNNSVSGLQTIGLPVRKYRGLDSASFSNMMDLLTDPNVCSVATRQRMGNHGATYDFSRYDITETFWFKGNRLDSSFAGATVIGSDGNGHCALASPGFGPNYPPDWGSSVNQGGVWHEGSHLEDASYYSASQLNPEGGITIRDLSTITNLYNAVYTITTVGQVILMTGTVTSGTFTITFTNGAGTSATTGTIAWNATAATVQAALVALSNIGASNVVCSGGPLPNTQILVQFQGTLAAFQGNMLTIAGTGVRYGVASLVGTTPIVKTARNEANSATLPEWYAEMRKHQRYARAGYAYTTTFTQSYADGQMDMVGWSNSGPTSYVTAATRISTFNNYMGTIIPIP